MLFEYSVPGSFYARGKQGNKSKRIKTCHSSAPLFLHLKSGNFSARMADAAPMPTPFHTAFLYCRSWSAENPVPQTPLQLGCRRVAWSPPIRCTHSGLRCGNGAGGGPRLGDWKAQRQRCWISWVSGRNFAHLVLNTMGGD